MEENDKEAIEFFEKHGIAWVRYPGGSISAEGDIDLRAKGITILPDFSNILLHGNFDCSHNQLKSLEGAPRQIAGWFECSHNELTSLEGAPGAIEESFACSNNQLSSLEGGPSYVGGNYYCFGNALISKAGWPHTVGGSMVHDHIGPRSAFEDKGISRDRSF